MTHRLEIPPELGGGWVEIKEKRSWADVKRIESAAAVGHRDDTGEMTFTFPALEMGIAQLECSVVRWSLQDENGSAIPPNRGGFVHEDFSAEMGDWLLTSISAYYEAQVQAKRAAGAAARESADVAESPAAG